MGLFSRKPEPTFTIPAAEVEAAAAELNAGNQKPADDLVARFEAAGGDGRMAAMAIIAASAE